MSVWKSDEKLLIYASLISPSKIILCDKFSSYNFGTENKEVKEEWTPLSYYSSRGLKPCGYKAIT